MSQKIVYVITERGGKTFWTRIGEAYVNRDGSLSVKLEALPVSGEMCIRSAARPIGSEPSDEDNETV